MTCSRADRERRAPTPTPFREQTGSPAARHSRPALRPSFHQAPFPAVERFPARRGSAWAFLPGLRLSELGTRGGRAAGRSGFWRSPRTFRLPALRRVCILYKSKFKVKTKRIQKSKANAKKFREGRTSPAGLDTKAQRAEASPALESSQGREGAGPKPRERISGSCLFRSPYPEKNLGEKKPRAETQGSYPSFKGR